MRLHLVGGFLGSGKTTAIMAVAQDLIAQGQTVGIITNDQGKYLVDTGFFKLANFPTVEVSGGCFCCNYNDLDGRLDELINSAHPDVIFAESVGSCCDLVATVIKSMANLRNGNLIPYSFSVFVDSRLLRTHLMGGELPFSENVVYIFEKQIEEAGLVVINKIDLLSEVRTKEVEDLFKKKYPAKKYLLQNTLVPNGTASWMKTISGAVNPLPEITLDINYQRYGAGEAQLAWLDEEWVISSQREEFIQMLESIVLTIKEQKIPIGHLKFLVEAGDGHTKLSLTTFEQPGWLDDLPLFDSTNIRLLINGRVQMDADKFKVLVDTVINSYPVQTEKIFSNAFHPGQPRPTHRFITNS